MRKLSAFLLSLLLVLIGFSLVQAQSDEVLVLDIDGPVTPVMANYFERGLEEAAAQDAQAVLIVLDTPGGSVDTMLDIVQLFRASEVPVIVYVGPRGAQAASAGSVITAAAHAAGMAPETVIGAASPINSDGSDIGETAFRKAVEDLKATMRSLTSRRGEEAVKLAESMIEEAVAVNSEEALAAGLIDAIATDGADLLNQLDGHTVILGDEERVLQTANATQRPFNLNWLEQILYAVTNPVVVGILMAIGVQAIIIEISNPGGWVAGFLGVLFVGLGLYGLGQLPVNWLGLGLIIVAFVLFIMEVNTPTHGALAFTGALTLLAGLLVLFNSPGTPDFARISIPGAVSIAVGTAAFTVFLLTMALRAHRRQPTTGAEGMVGQKGIVRQAFTAVPDGEHYRGTVLVHGELWQAEADEAIGYGEPVTIKQMNGFTLRVARAGSV